MVALEQEIVEKFRLLDKDAQQRVLQVLKDQASPFDWRVWFEEVEALHVQMQDKQRDLPPVDVVQLLREVREEE